MNNRLFKGMYMAAGSGNTDGAAWVIFQ